jgi:hypothetical protein
LTGTHEGILCFYYGLAWAWQGWVTDKMYYPVNSVNNLARPDDRSSRNYRAIIGHHYRAAGNLPVGWDFFQGVLYRSV